MKFEIVYEPRIEDPVVVASFVTRSEADEYTQELQSSRPRTHKHCQIVEKG